MKVHAAAFFRAACLAVAVVGGSSGSLSGHVTQAGSTEDVQGQNQAESALDGVFRVSLLTVGRGAELWDSFGHNALLIENTVTGQAVAYDWGRFSFAQEGFFKNLLMGRMLYSMGWAPAQALIEHYQGLNRTVTLQRLNLDTSATITLVREIERRQASPEYRYEYFLDNCSTQVRDLIDQASGGALARHGARADEDYRFHTRRLTQHSIPLWAGFDVLLGNRGDRPISRWEAMFTPLELLEEVREVDVDINGMTVPLVAEEQIVFASTRADEEEEPKSMLLPFLLVGALLGGVIAFLGFRSGRGDRLARAGFALVAGSWSLVAGLVGVALLFVWVTDHVWMHWNENALQFTPLSVLLMPLVVLAAWRGRAGRALLLIAGTAAGLSALGFVLQVLPGFDQANGELIALALPAHLGLLWALWEMSSVPDTPA